MQKQFGVTIASSVVRKNEGETSSSGYYWLVQLVTKFRTLISLYFVIIAKFTRMDIGFN